MKLIIDIDKEDIKVVENTEFTVEELFETTNGRIYRAICKALLDKKMLADVLDKIRDEIMVKHFKNIVRDDYSKGYSGALEEVFDVIDKYRNEVSK